MDVSVCLGHRASRFASLRISRARDSSEVQHKTSGLHVLIKRCWTDWMLRDTRIQKSKTEI